MTASIYSRLSGICQSAIGLPQPLRTIDPLEHSDVVVRQGKGAQSRPTRSAGRAPSRHVFALFLTFISSSISFRC
jgi:hypothetical protein